MCNTSGCKRYGIKMSVRRKLQALFGFRLGRRAPGHQTGPPPDHPGAKMSDEGIIVLLFAVVGLLLVFASGWRDKTQWRADFRQMGIERVRKRVALAGAGW